jgi:hypothetical protein
MPVFESAELAIIWRDAGMKNDFNDEHSWNASASIRLSFDPDSKVNDESDAHEWKQPVQNNLTDIGI